jgi:hypothetical protein
VDSNLIIKNVTFAIGMAFLVYGALNFDIQDWDLGVSVVMAFCTYCTADWVINVLRRSEYRKWPLALFFVWFSVDGSYFAYWQLVNPDAMLRGVQWLPSLFMYLLCGVIWSSLPTPLQALALFREAKDRFVNHQ